MAAQDACRGQHFLVHVALCVPNMSISISMWVRPVPESFLRLSQKSKEQPDLCRSQQDCFSGISRTGECRLQFRVFGNPAAERPAGRGRLDVAEVVFSSGIEVSVVVVFIVTAFLLDYSFRL